MKKQIFILLMGLCLSTAMMAQSWSGGVLLGFTTSQVDGDSYGGYKKLGPVFGGYARRNFNDRIGLQPEISFNQRGAREVKGFTFWHSRMNCLDVPVLLSYRVIGDNERGIRLMGGPQFATVLGGTVASGHKDNKVDVSQFLNRFEVMGLLGPEFYINHNLSLDIRWGYSLFRFNKKVNTTLFDFRSAQFHHLWQFTLRYDLNPL